MGQCYNSPLYKFTNFITIQKNLPQKQQKNVQISKFQFQIHPFSEDYIRQTIDPHYNPDIDGDSESFIVSEDQSMKVFEMNEELSTKKTKISSCLESALIGKLCDGSQVANKEKIKKIVVFSEPQGREDIQKFLFTIIIETLISLDMTFFNEKPKFGVYFNWTQFMKGKNPDYLVELAKQINQRSNLMDNTRNL